MLAKKQLSAILMVLIVVTATVLIAPSVSAQGRIPPTLTPTATATKVPPTATAVPPTATKAPATATQVAPTATKVPATATSVPPTATKVPPTATKVPPTATPAKQLRVPTTGGATSQAWDSSITYYTSSGVAGSMTVVYYDGATTYTTGSYPLNPHQAGSIYIGSVSTTPAFPGTFSGSAVLSADVPIAATYVQFVKSPDTNNYGRMLSSSFDSTQGGTTFYIPTILNANGGNPQTSRIGVQNIDSSNPATAVLKFYAVGSSTPTLTITQTIQPQASYIAMANAIGLPSPFNGSLVINSTGGSVVAASEETDDNGTGAYMFEGRSSGSNSIYMPSMQCNAFSDLQISYYAIQNTHSSLAASVVITYYNNTGGVEVVTPPYSLPAGNKVSKNPCADGVASGKYGSALITSTGGQIIAIGKVKSNGGVSTAFTGFAQGSTKVAAPYVRWSNPSTSDFRSFISIMNVGPSAATNIVATYYNGNGVAVATQNVATAGTPLNPFIKRNTDPSSAGALNSCGTFGFACSGVPAGGAVEITSDQPIAVVIRSQKDVSPPLGSINRFAEDYNAIPVP